MEITRNKESLLKICRGGYAVGKAKSICGYEFYDCRL